MLGPTPPTELVSQPISSIEDPTSSSFLQQSSACANPVVQETEGSIGGHGASFNLESRPDTQMSGNSS